MIIIAPSVGEEIIITCNNLNNCINVALYLLLTEQNVMHYAKTVKPVVVVVPTPIIRSLYNFLIKIFLG